MTAKASAMNELSKQDLKYLELIDKYLAELKSIQQETARRRADGRQITQRIDRNLKEIQAIIDRVQATL